MKAAAIAEGGTGAVLTAQHLWWRFPRNDWLIRDLNLNLQAGSLLKIGGHNGAGKSTLLRLLAGCLAPHRGTVRSASRVAYLPQQLTLPAIAAPRLLDLLSAPGPRRSASFTAGLDMRVADKLSGGTARRLVLEAVFSLPARVIVLDEPAVGLDHEGLALLWESIRGRLADGSAVVIAAHDSLLSVDVDQHLMLGGTSTDATGERFRVELVGRGTLRGQQSRNGQLTLHLLAGEVDQILLEALQAGWSVRTVEALR